ncbi:flagellar biosynthesis anti-sigma factor FlgM [bacterium]|nr:flagellar biosynthesis anti-sigma factor FlgM [bacterium]
MTLGSVNDAGSTQPIGPKPVDPTQSTTGKAPREVEKPQSPGRTDSTEISVDAKEISRYQEMVRLHREAYGESIPQDREEQLAQVKTRIAEGFYDSEEGMDKLAERLVEGTVDDAGATKDLSTVRRRTQEGYYDREEVVDRTAANMLKDIIQQERERGRFE